MYNRVVLLGQVISDLTVVKKKDETYCDFIIECRRVYMVNGSKKVETITVKVLTWGENARICSEKLKRGAFVLVEGALKFDTEERYYYIGSWNVIFLDRYYYQEETSEASEAK